VTIRLPDPLFLTEMYPLHCCGCGGDTAAM